MAKRPIKGKNLKVEIANPKKGKPEWKLMIETGNPKINRLIEVYKENPKHARILFHQGQKQEYTCLRGIKYTYENGDINLVTFEKSFGISVTNKMYNSERIMRCIIYKKDSDKWYYKEGSSIRLLTFEHISSFFQNLFPYSIRFNNSGYDFLKELLPWLRNIEEDRHSISHCLPINTIISKKLYNLKAVYRHLFKVPYPVIDMMLKSKSPRSFDTNMLYFLKMWPQMHKVLINVENLREEMFSHHMFIDTCKMAGSVGEKVNCSWGIKRLVEEHDKWSKEITNVLLLNEKKTPMLIHQVYEEFAKFSKLRMLVTNYEMVEDGMVMQHCVASYINKVNQGQSRSMCDI